MSALPPRADIRGSNWNVRFGPKAGIKAVKFDVRITCRTGHPRWNIIVMSQEQ